MSDETEPREGIALYDRKGRVKAFYPADCVWAFLWIETANIVVTSVAWLLGASALLWVAVQVTP